MSTHTAPATLKATIPASPAIIQRAAAALPSFGFDSLPDTAFARESALVSKPGRPGVLPFSSATLWRKVNAGEFPKPVKLSERVTAWQVGAVRAWLQSRAAA